MNVSTRGTKKQAGAYWETFARAHLEAAGLVLLERNFNCRHGELDLVMRDRDVIVFVEVRYRRAGAAGRFGGGVESIGRDKRTKLARAAAAYLALHAQLARHACRFDVVAIGDGDAGAPTLEWIRNAFEPA